MTSMRRHYVASTSLRRDVPAGSLPPPMPPPYSKPWPPQYSKPSYAYDNDLLVVVKYIYKTPNGSVVSHILSAKLLNQSSSTFYHLYIMNCHLWKVIRQTFLRFNTPSWSFYTQSPCNMFQNQIKYSWA